MAKPIILGMELRAACARGLAAGRPRGQGRCGARAACRGRSTLDAQAALREPTPACPAGRRGRAWCRRRHVPRRSPFTPEGRAALLHAVAHIEFNAINLALDAVWRFAGMPEAYYRDWLRVAAEEALHFTLLREHLASLGHDYGDFDAHDGLWAMAERTAGDITARMALVPRTLEARGLDATPPMQAQAGQGRRRSSGRDPRRHPARRDRPRGHRQPLVPLAVRARRARCRSPHYDELARATVRRACAARSTSRRGAPPASRRSSWTPCSSRSGGPAAGRAAGDSAPRRRPAAVGRRGQTDRRSTRRNEADRHQQGRVRARLQRMRLAAAQVDEVAGPQPMQRCGVRNSTSPSRH